MRSFFSDKTDNERSLNDAGRPGDETHLPGLEALLLPIGQEVFRVQLAALPNELQAGILAGPPAPNHRWTIFVVPCEPSGHAEVLRGIADVRANDLREAPQIYDIADLSRLVQQLSDEFVILRQRNFPAESFIVPRIKNSASGMNARFLHQ